MNVEKLKALLDDMSLDEKIGQLLQLTGLFFQKDVVITGPEGKCGFTDNDINLTGSILGTMGAEKLKKIQDEYQEKQPHHIPLLFMCDIINGYRTVFPIPLAQGCSFDPDLVCRAAQISAKESAAAGLHVTFSPMVDLVHDARWGRVMESTGEDPWLNSLYAKAIVEGYQGDSDHIGHGKIAACVKHFAAYGAPIGGREYNTVEISERTLREEYLPSYKAAVDAGAAMVMTSFNTLNRTPSSGNKKLMRGILREEMNFDGVLISDWAAIEEMVQHGVVENREQAAAVAIDAGVDIDMCTTSYAHNLKNLIEKKIVSVDLVNEAVWRILTLKNKLGLFENPYKDADAAEEKNIILCEAHRNEARKITADTFVLLKNENILPLAENKSSVAFIGPHIENREIYGFWSMYGEKDQTVSIADALRERFTDVKVAKGSPMLDASVGARVYADRKDLTATEEETKALLEEAETLAANVDTVVLALGEYRAMSGECKSRANICIPDCQMELFRRVHAVNPNVVVVLFTGRPLDIRDISQKAKGILVVWQPGTEGGHAIADTLYGEVNPSGKLSMSFPYSVGQVPVFYNEMRTGRPLKVGEEGYTSCYLDIPNTPLYPFGFGLSYSDFSISPITLSEDKMRVSGEMKASVNVKNTGSRKGKIAVQLYIKDHYAAVARPVRELKSIKKIELDAGEEQTVDFVIDRSMLEYIGPDMNYTVDPGVFSVYIGDCSTTENEAVFEVV